MKKIGIIGSRRKDDTGSYKKVKDQFLEIYEDGDWIVSGGCSKGGDRFAEEIAKRYGVPIMIYHANWKKFGKGAGLIRNGDIAKDSDVIIACVADDRTGGTEDTIEKFTKKITDNNLFKKLYIV